MREIVGFVVDDNFQRDSDFASFFYDFKTELGKKKIDTILLVVANNSLYHSEQVDLGQLPLVYSPETKIDLVKNMARFCLIHKGLGNKWKEVGKVDYLISLSKTTVNSYFDYLQIPYVGIKPKTLYTITNQVIFREILNDLKIKSMPGFYLSDDEKTINKELKKSGLPVMINSVECLDINDVLAQVEQLPMHYDPIFVEKKIVGATYSVAYLSTKEEHLLSIVISDEGYISNEITERIRFSVLKLAENLQLQGVYLFTFIYSTESDELYLKLLDPAPAYFARVLWARSDVPLGTLLTNIVAVAKQQNC